VDGALRSGRGAGNGLGTDVQIGRGGGQPEQSGSQLRIRAFSGSKIEDRIPQLIRDHAEIVMATTKQFTDVLDLEDRILDKVSLSDIGKISDFIGNRHELYDKRRNCFFAIHQIPRPLIAI